MDRNNAGAFPQLVVLVLENKDDSILRSTLGSPFFGKRDGLMYNCENVFQYYAGR